jgi:hypothetical protein
MADNFLTYLMINKLISLIRRLLTWHAPKTYSLAIVRRYTDANGSFVGELYLLGSFAGVLGYRMIGVSLDTLPFDCQNGAPSFDLDTEHDFLGPMPVGCLRVGAQDPRDNDAVRDSVARLARTGTISLQVQNRFIEHVMVSKPRARDNDYE